MNKSSLHTKVKKSILSALYSIQYHKFNEDIMGSTKFLVENRDEGTENDIY